MCMNQVNSIPNDRHNSRHMPTITLCNYQTSNRVYTI
nr:MAG TPA: hypothetical protein [Caudoviricetes sp.]DAT64831.1 MAG TPA: hypothetical protein [Caudoviricetes sp.]